MISQRLFGSLRFFRGWKTEYVVWDISSFWLKRVSCSYSASDECCPFSFLELIVFGDDFLHEFTQTGECQTKYQLYKVPNWSVRCGFWTSSMLKSVEIQWRNAIAQRLMLNFAWRSKSSRCLDDWLLNAFEDVGEKYSTRDMNTLWKNVCLNDQLIKSYYGQCVSIISGTWPLIMPMMPHTTDGLYVLIDKVAAPEIELQEHIIVKCKCFLSNKISDLSIQTCEGARLLPLCSFDANTRNKTTV